MKSLKQRAAWIMGMAMLIVASCPVLALAEEEEYVPALYDTAWALLPPVVAIGLALITKEVYSSLFIGIVVGGLLYSGFGFEGTFVHVLQDGIIMNLSDSYNVGILVFLVTLCIIVCLMNMTGGSAAFGRWAGTKIKTRTGAQLTTVLLGCLIFVDDYFNCLTVGSVMRPITESHRVSKAKLSYLIDATAAPVCIIAPVSSWAAAVSGFVEGEDGFAVFIRAIPWNYYALLTIFFMIMTTILRIDFGPMRKHEENAIKYNDIYTTPERPFADSENVKVNENGKVIDTSMGLTPLDGFEMGTRCGGIDPSVIIFLQQKEGLTPEETDELLNKKSGALGVSGVSSDDRDLRDAIMKGNERAKLARDIQWYQIRKFIGSYVAAMDGIDALVFAGGIGENTDDLRTDVCSKLSFLGFEIDEEANKAALHGVEKEITTPNSKVRAFVIPTNEELVIARETKELVLKAGK